MRRVLKPMTRRMLWAAIFTLSLPFLIFGQQQHRVVDWQPVTLKSDAKILEMVDIKVAGESIDAGRFFTANETWLNALTFRVKNISGKTIKHFGFGVAFPEIGSNGGSPGFSVTYYGAEYTEGAAGARKLLMPDEEVDLKLAEDQLEIMRQVSTRLRGTPDLSKLNILPGLVAFEDGSGIGGFSLRRQATEKR